MGPGAPLFTCEMGVLSVLLILDLTRATGQEHLLWHGAANPSERLTAFLSARTIVMVMDGAFFERWQLDMGNDGLR
jgi:hypothetical protein